MIRKKILIISPGLSMGGIERASVNTAHGLGALNCEVFFLSIFKKEHFFKLNGEINLIEPDGINKSSLSLLKTIFWIRSEITKIKPDSILVFNKFYGAITSISLIGLPFAFVLSERSSPLYKWKFPLNFLNRIAFWINPPVKVIAQTEVAAKFQSNYYRKSQILVIPNSIREVKRFPEIKREKVILAVGRLNDKLKGFDLLIKSFSFLNNNNDWELHFAGGDEEGKELKELAKSLGIDKKVKFLGRISNIDVCYASAGIFVMPSRSEGFPNALVEAMSAGCCCVAFDFIAGPKEIIVNSQNGMIVENGNTKKMAEVLDMLICSPDVRIGLSLEALKIREKLQIDTISKKIYKVLLSN